MKYDSTMLTPKITPLCMSNWIAVGQTVRTYVGEPQERNGFVISRHSRSLKVIERDTDRSGIYDLLVIQSKYGLISYRFRDKW